MGLLGPEVADAKALAIPLDQAEILVTEKGVVGKALKEFRQEDFAGQIQVVRMERGGVPFPWGPKPNCSGSTCSLWRGSRARWRRWRAVWGGWPDRARRPTS